MQEKGADTAKARHDHCPGKLPEGFHEELSLDMGPDRWTGRSLSGSRRRGRQKLDDITNPMDMSLSELQGIVKDREAWCAPGHGIAKS